MSLTRGSQPVVGGRGVAPDTDPRHPPWLPRPLGELPDKLGGPGASQCPLTGPPAGDAAPFLFFMLVEHHSDPSVQGPRGLWVWVRPLGLQGLKPTDSGSLGDSPGEESAIGSVVIRS